VRLVGFRAHRLGDEGHLLAINEAFGEWQRGENQAELNSHFAGYGREIGLLAPHGFHAHYKFDEALAGGLTPFYQGVRYPITAVTGWGRIALHRTGWRSQFAEIHAILSTQDRAIDEAIRKRYDVAVVQYPDELREIALKYGVEITDPSAEMEGIREIERAPESVAVAAYYMGQPITAAQVRWLQAQPGFPWTNGGASAPALPATTPHMPLVTGGMISFPSSVSSWSMSGSISSAQVAALQSSFLGTAAPTSGYARLAIANNAAQTMADSLKAAEEAAEASREKMHRARNRVFITLAVAMLSFANLGLDLTHRIPQLWTLGIDGFVLGFSATFWFGPWLLRKLSWGMRHHR
jgi:hypothetical protein